MNIQRQGYFREMLDGEDNDPSIKDFINKMSPDLVDKIVSYLENGIAIIVCAGPTSDIINPERGLAGVPSVLTDGVWYWPGDLAYYVKNYRVLLPSEFLDTMKSNDWKIPISFDYLDLQNISMDGKLLF